MHHCSLSAVSFLSKKTVCFISVSMFILSYRCTIVQLFFVEKPKTEIEIRAAMRDMKRRRQSYKGKNVHTASKSYSEVRTVD
jgi:hypothetical protein